MESIQTGTTEGAGVAPLCHALGVSRSTYYRQQGPPRQEPQPRPSPPRALDSSTRQEVLDVLHSERFVDRSPAEVVYTLLEEGTYLCSERTMYRILEENQECRERRNQLRHPEYKKPELVATAPNQVWSWDITKLKGPAKWKYYYLYVMLDIFSRYVVGWMIAAHENANLAKHLIRETCQNQGIHPNTLVIHSDRGSPMTAKTTAQLLATLDVERSLSRPHVSDDNPFSESHFKTLKYSPGFPNRFGSITDALVHCRTFFKWYNRQHRHSGIQYLTPYHVHYGEAEQLLQQRRQTMLETYNTHPERFVQGPPKLQSLPVAVWINPPARQETDLAAGVGVPVTPQQAQPPLAPAEQALGGPVENTHDGGEGAHGTILSGHQGDHECGNSTDAQAAAGSLIGVQ